MQDYSNSNALALELLQSCTKPSICASEWHCEVRIHLSTRFHKMWDQVYCNGALNYSCDIYPNTISPMDLFDSDLLY